MLLLLLLMLLLLLLLLLGLLLLLTPPAVALLLLLTQRHNPTQHAPAAAAAGTMRSRRVSKLLPMPAANSDRHSSVLRMARACAIGRHSNGTRSSAATGLCTHLVGLLQLEVRCQTSGQLGAPAASRVPPGAVRIAGLPSCCCCPCQPQPAASFALPAAVSSSWWL